MEQWRSVVGFEGIYEVSDHGCVRRVGASRGARQGRPVALASHKQGYKAVVLYARNKAFGRLVHRLVAAAFIGPVPDGCEVNHRDGDKANNWVGNLEYISRTENIRHAMALGLIDNRGERNPASKLTAEQVSAIAERYRAGLVGYKRLAAEYGVRPEQIRNIVRRGQWPTVTGSSGMRT